MANKAEISRLIAKAKMLAMQDKSDMYDSCVKVLQKRGVPLTLEQETPAFNTNTKCLVPSNMASMQRVEVKTAMYNDATTYILIRGMEGKNYAPQGNGGRGSLKVSPMCRAQLSQMRDVMTEVGILMPAFSDEMPVATTSMANTVSHGRQPTVSIRSGMSLLHGATSGGAAVRPAAARYTVQAVEPAEEYEDANETEEDESIRTLRQKLEACPLDFLKNYARELMGYHEDVEIQLIGRDADALRWDLIKAASADPTFCKDLLDMLATPVLPVATAVANTPRGTRAVPQVYTGRVQPTAVPSMADKLRVLTFDELKEIVKSVRGEFELTIPLAGVGRKAPAIRKDLLDAANANPAVHEWICNLLGCEALSL